MRLSALVGSSAVAFQIGLMRCVLTYGRPDMPHAAIFLVFENLLLLDAGALRVAIVVLTCWEMAALAVDIACIMLSLLVCCICM